MLFGLVQVPLARGASPTNKKTSATTVQTIVFFMRNTPGEPKLMRPGQIGPKVRPLHGTSRRMPAVTAESKLQKAAQLVCGLMRFHLRCGVPATRIHSPRHTVGNGEKECYLHEGSLASLIL